jgi:hypothetical protein
MQLISFTLHFVSAKSFFVWCLCSGLKHTQHRSFSDIELPSQHDFDLAFGDGVQITLFSFLLSMFI